MTHWRVDFRERFSDLDKRDLDDIESFFSGVIEDRLSDERVKYLALKKQTMNAMQKISDALHKNSNLPPNET